MLFSFISGHVVHEVIGGMVVCHVDRALLGIHSDSSPPTLKYEVTAKEQNGSKQIDGEQVVPKGTESRHLALHKCLLSE